jgi:hypothetical protein
MLGGCRKAAGERPERAGRLRLLEDETLVPKTVSSLLEPKLDHGAFSELFVANPENKRPAERAFFLWS